MSARDQATKDQLTTDPLTTDPVATDRITRDYVGRLVQALLRSAEALTKIAYDDANRDLIEAEEGHLIVALSRIQLLAADCYERRKGVAATKAMQR